MDIVANELLKIVTDSIELFNQKEVYLIENDLSEQCICSRFAMHLTNIIKATKYFEYEVDVEYNRGRDGCERALKRIHNKLIRVDLVVHKRGFDCQCGFDNLICIEMKKATNRKGTISDEKRLADMTSCDYGFLYKLGCMIMIDIENKKLFLKKTFQCGKET